MAGFNNGTGLRRPWLVTLSLVTALAAIAVAVLLWQAVELSSLTVVSDRVEQAKPLMSGVRLALIGWLTVFWSRLSFLGARSGTDTHTTRAQWMVLRWRVAGWLLVIELVIGQDLFGRFVSAVAGSA